MQHACGGLHCFSPVVLLALQVTISLQIPSRAGHLAFTAALASVGFGLIACARVSNQPFRVTLQVGALLH